MHMLNRRSDVRSRATRFEAVQEEAVLALSTEKAQHTLGELATTLTTYIELAEPVGVNRRNEIVIPKTTDLKRPLVFMLREGEAGVFTLPATTFKSDIPYLDGHSSKGNRTMTISPDSMSGYHSLAVAADQGRGPVLATFPQILRVMPEGALSFVASTMGHEVEHWRFMAEQDYQALGRVSYGIVETATERGAYRVNEAIEPQGRPNPNTESIAQAIRMKDTIDPVEAYRIVTRPYVRTQVESRYLEALAFSRIFGDDTPVPTDLEFLAYQAAGLIDAHHV